MISSLMAFIMVLAPLAVSDAWLALPNLHAAHRFWYE